MPDFRFISRLICSFAVSIAAFGQSAETSAEFETATVSVSAPNSRSRQTLVRIGRFEMRGATMVDLVSFAYKVEPDKVAGGPSWLEMERYDVIAKVNGRPPAQSLRPMLRALLADRFKLVANVVTRPMPAYMLTPGKKLNLKKSETPGDSTCPMMARMPQPVPDGPPPTPVLTVACHGMTMSAFAEQIRFMPSQLNGAPVIDKTGIDGLWDLELSFSAAQTGGAVAFAEALEKQLGLKLELGSAPLEVVAVERVNRIPSPDPPGAVEAMKRTEPPTEFEVADIKPTAPDFLGTRFQFPPGGRVDFKGVTLGLLIQQAYELTSLTTVVGVPAWFSTDRYDIVAKAPSAANMIDLSRFASMNRGGPTVENELSWTMIRALLKERFKLETHWEDRPGTGYALVAGKPKLKKADPESRTKSSASPVDPKGGGERLIQYSFQNFSMAEFAARLQLLGRAFGYFATPVLDSTGIEGRYDFVLAFSQRTLMAGGRGAPVMAVRRPDGPGAPAGADSTLSASDPMGGITLQDAVEKLGLKLEKQNRPVPVLVIDHIERKPTDN
jgi:uncharacterized protein (TIGR03435 family)